MFARHTALARRFRAGGLILLASALVASGCGIFSVSGKSTARVEVENSEQAAVMLITSSDFGIGVDEMGEVVYHLFVADTAWVNTNTPFVREYDLRETGLFYVRAAQAEEAESSTTMRVYVDGKEEFNATVVLTDIGLQWAFMGF